MENKAIAHRVVQALLEPDTLQNLNQDPTLQEEMEDAAGGSYVINPQPETLLYRQYNPMPLVIRPEYSGDFLEKLRREPKYAANPYNIYDFTMPSEMLKHQEHPMPDDRRDLWYGFNRPGDGAGMETLKDWSDRSWEPYESPEMSLDKLERLRKIKETPPELLNPIPIRNETLKSIVSSHLLQISPLVFTLDMPRSKVAVMLDDLAKSERKGKGGVYRRVSPTPISPVRQTNRPKTGTWVFTVPGETCPERGPYRVSFQFIPEGTTRDVSKLHVRVSCTCPSWVFWGAQYHAYMGSYLYGPVQVMPPATGGATKKPTVRDPAGHFLACKHIIRCIELVKNYRLDPKMTEQVRRRIKQRPKTKVQMPDKWEVRIPKDLIDQEKKPKVDLAVREWERWTPHQRRRHLDRIDDPDSVTFLAYRFPKTALGPALERLREIEETTVRHSEKKKAQEGQERLTSGPLL